MQDMRQSGGVGRQRALQTTRQHGLNCHSKAQGRGEDRSNQTSVTHVEREVVWMTMLIVGQPVEWRMGIDNSPKQFSPRSYVLRGLERRVSIAHPGSCRLAR
jgi:hypothetical protein